MKSEIPPVFGDMMADLLSGQVCLLLFCTDVIVALHESLMSDMSPNLCVFCCRHPGRDPALLQYRRRQGRPSADGVRAQLHDIRAAVRLSGRPVQPEVHHGGRGVPLESHHAPRLFHVGKFFRAVFPV